MLPISARPPKSVARIRVPVVGGRKVKAEVIKHLDKLTKTDPEKLVERRIKKFCDMGVVLKAKPAARKR